MGKPVTMVRKESVQEMRNSMASSQGSPQGSPKRQGSSKAYSKTIAKQIQGTRSSCLIIPTSSTFMKHWDLVMVAALLFTAIVTPIEVCFLDEGRIRGAL